ncbi:MAG TPA: hypothetical protein VHR86_04940 [Armatimonadota bacterium]|nr:hypothetical protein [Armatimonadota bacterium]
MNLRKRIERLEGQVRGENLPILLLDLPEDLTAEEREHLKEEDRKSLRSGMLIAYDWGDELDDILPSWLK